MKSNKNYYIYHDMTTVEHPYYKWLRGWVDGGETPNNPNDDSAWKRAYQIKPANCSWYALGLLMATEQRFGRESGCAETKEHK